MSLTIHKLICRQLSSSSWKQWALIHTKKFFDRPSHMNIARLDLRLLTLFLSVEEKRERLSPYQPLAVTLTISHFCTQDGWRSTVAYV